MEVRGSLEEKAPETGALSSTRLFSSAFSTTTAVYVTVISSKTGVRSRHTANSV